MAKSFRLLRERMGPEAVARASARAAELARAIPRRVAAVIQDLRTEEGQRIRIRFDSRDVITLPADYDYDGRRSAVVPRHVEALEDGAWRPYPAVAVRASRTYVIALARSGGFALFASPEGRATDERLACAAEGCGALVARVTS